MTPRAVIYEGTASDSMQVRREIAQRIRDGVAAPKAPSRLPIGAIEMVPALFQPRSSGEWQSESHVGGLARGVTDAKQTAGKVTLPHVVVFWIGDAYACLDGHHRLAAIRGPLKASRAATIAVEVFEGTLDAAMLEATRLNSPTKLPMTEADRSERAWKLFLLKAGTHDAIATACMVSSKTVQRMAQAVRHLGVDAEALDVLACSSWYQVRLRMNGEPKQEIDMDARTADKVRRLSEVLNRGIKGNGPSLVAMALIQLDPERAGEIQRILKQQLDPDNPYTMGMDGLPQFPEGTGEEF